MPTPKWLVVARNEYRIRTSRIRRIRPYFPYLAVGLLGIYVVFIAPSFVSVFIDDFLALLLSQVAVATVQIILFMSFIYFTILPITGTLREERTGQLEIFLSAPIRPSDILLGEFLGEMPFYGIAVTVVAGLFTALLNPMGLDVVQITIIIIIFIITLLSALWIGSVTAAILRTKLGETARGRDIGRALAMIIVLPFLALFYAIQFGGMLEALADPKASGTVKTVLGLLPSSWGAEVIVGFALNPGNIGAVGFEALARFGGLIAFFVAVLWLGAKAANRAYTLETVTFIASRAKPDGTFYRTVRSLGGGRSFGTLLVSVFKDYGRRLENISNITYILGLLVIMTIFVAPQFSGGPDGAPYALLIPQAFIFSILVVMVTGEVTVRGKETLFIFKKAPSGVGNFVTAMLLRSWLMAVPIAGAVTAVITVLVVQTDFISSLATTGVMMVLVAGNVAFVLGLFLLNPAFSEKSVKLFLNVMITIFVSAGSFIASMWVAVRPGETIAGVMWLHIQLLQTALSWLLGIVFLYLGKRKLSRIE